MLAAKIILMALGIRLASPAQAEIYSLKVIHLLKKIHGQPQMDSPPRLDWTSEQSSADEGMVGPESSLDFHAGVENCDLAFYTFGNFYPVLNALWPKFLKSFSEADKPRNWIYITGYPPPVENIEHDFFHVQNVKIHCRPQVILAHQSYMDEMVEKGLVDGKPIPFGRTTSFVLLVRKGNPKHIHSVLDLAKPGISVVTSNPRIEPVSFTAMARFFYATAKAELKRKGNPRHTADQFLDQLFNQPKKSGKWRVVDGVAHRWIPWSLSFGKGDVSALTYQIALAAKEQNPKLFDIINIEDFPEAPGFARMFIAKIKGDWTERQKKITASLVELLLSPQATEMLKKYKIERIQQ
jgi:hypothetical protein